MFAPYVYINNPFTFIRVPYKVLLESELITESNLEYRVLILFVLQNL